jgi:polysaccharide biosynthesis protein PslG
MSQFSRQSDESGTIALVRSWTPTSVMRNRTVLIGLHAVVIVGLLVSVFITIFHHSYMTRGVSFSPPPEPIPHTDVNPLGVNTFLHEEVEFENVERSMEMLADAGFTWIRQIFVWSEIEPAPGVFWDDRHDVSTWEKYDRIMHLADQHGLDVVVRLDKPPRWAQEERGNVEEFPDGPPDDYQYYADFVTAVVERYLGQIRYVQLWNEPNLGVEWGGLDVDPAEFTELLAAGYEAVKAVDPSVAVIMPGLAPNDQTGPENMSDLLFLEGMYAAGAQDYFDIAAVMIYGYGFSPWDRRVAFERNNFSRAVQTREIMEANGDHDTPIWAVEYGWVSLPDDWAGEPSPWGQPVTEEEQARNLLNGYVRAQQEWPWMGAMIIWGFRWPANPTHEDQAANPTLGFRIVDHSFEPRPAYTLLSEHSEALDRAWVGRYGPDSRYLIHGDDWSLTRRNGQPALQPETGSARLQIPFAGTAISLDFAGTGGRLSLQIDDDEWEIDAGNLSDGAYRISGLSRGQHTLDVRVTEAGADPLAIAGFAVERRTARSWIYPWLYGAIGLALLLNIGSLAGTITTQPAERRPIRRSERLRRAMERRRARRET